MTTITATVDSVATATTVNTVLSGEQLIDGVTTNLSRVLVKNQTDPRQNGIYISNPLAWTRATDFSTTVLPGTYMYNQGTQYVSSQYATGWIVSAPGTGTNSAVIVGTDPVIFSQAFLQPYLYPPATSVYVVSSALGICKAQVQSVAVSQTSVLTPAVVTYTVVYSNPSRGSAQVDSSTVFAQTSVGAQASWMYYQTIIT